MSRLNEPNIPLSFKMVREYIKSSVPPCTATIDTPTHYESVAVNGEEKHLYGYVIAHQHVITVGFSMDIPDNAMHQLFSERLRKMMNEHRRLEIRDAHVNDLRQDLQDACEHLLYYYNQIGWTK